MSKVTQKVSTSFKIVAAILTPLLITVISFYIYGLYIMNLKQIYPNISIAGIDVSGMTKYEAMQSLGLEAYQRRGAETRVNFTFPDGSEFTIDGNDAMMHHNASDVVDEALAIGRGRGVFRDLITYIGRDKAEEIALDIDFFIEESQLQNAAEIVTEDFNLGFSSSVPRVFEDRVIFTKGAGHVTASADEVFELAYNGLFKSLETGEPVGIEYVLPETVRMVNDIIDLRNKLFVQMVSSEFDPEAMAATESFIGVDFNAVLAARILSNVKSGQTIELPLIFTHPEYSQEYLDSLLFRDLIAERTTHAHGTQARLTNIRLASEEIDGLILLAGDEFSFNGVVGRRSPERGFQMAPIMVRDAVETQFSYGGGVCQVASTIYAAIRPSQILVTDQRKHSEPVPYLPWGHDATVFYPYIDFKFVNNTDYPMRLDVELDERNVIVHVWGTIKDDFPRKADWND